MPRRRNALSNEFGSKRRLRAPFFVFTVIASEATYPEIDLAPIAVTAIAPNISTSINGDAT